MIRLFKHYIPHAVLLLGLLDLVLLVLASELAWQVRAGQIGMEVDSFATRWLPLTGTAMVIWLAMIAVGVYGPNALRSLRFAGARVLVAISLGIIALAVVDFVFPSDFFWRSTLLYTMGLAILVLVADRLLLTSFLGSSAFRRRGHGSGRRRPGAASARTGRAARNRFCDRCLYRHERGPARRRGSDPRARRSMISVVLSENLRRVGSGVGPAGTP